MEGVPVYKMAAMGGFKAMKWLHQTFVLENKKYKLWEDEGYVQCQGWALMKLLQMYWDHVVLDDRPSVRMAEEWGFQWTNIGKDIGQSTKNIEGTVKHLCV